MDPLFRVNNEKVQCTLCPHFCAIAEGKNGICGIRKNVGARIELQTYGILSASSLDPVEKKPLYHFFPGTNIFSVGSFGCNMRCDFCQNYHISQTAQGNQMAETKPAELARAALVAKNNIGLAFTYNEPVIWFEFVADTAAEVKKNGQYTALVTNGFINSEPLQELIEVTDAFNVDLKAFNNEFYRKLTGASLEPVKSSLKQIARAGKHLEITTLIITGQNDSEQEMENQVKWISSELGNEIPFHLSRYFPMYKRDDPTTPHETLLRLYEIASGSLRYVYMGNTMSETGQDTKCPACGTVVTKRSGYNIRLLNIRDGKCSACGKEIYRYSTFSS
jgi:pyruvate formate lyase activating enzyme